MAGEILNPKRWQRAGKNQSPGFSENWELGTGNGKRYSLAPIR
jgi:hypothetical protein